MLVYAVAKIAIDIRFIFRGSQLQVLVHGQVILSENFGGVP